MLALLAGIAEVCRVSLTVNGAALILAQASMDSPKYGHGRHTDRLVGDVAAQDKYSSLHRHLLSACPDWQMICLIRQDYAGPYRPVRWWASLAATRPPGRCKMVCGRSGHRSEDDAARIPGNITGVERSAARQRRFSIREILPPHHPGPWPEGFTVSREQIYDEFGRLTGGPRDDAGGSR